MTLLNLILNKLEIESAEVFIMEVRDRIIVRVILTLSQPHVSFPPSHLFPLQHQSKRRASNKTLKLCIVFMFIQLESPCDYSTYFDN